MQLRGVRPFFSDKFDITKHPRYKYLADADKKNTFDIERYMKRRPAIVKPDEPFNLYELKAIDFGHGPGRRPAGVGQHPPFERLWPGHPGL